MTSQQVRQKLRATDKNSITFQCGGATIIAHLKAVPLMECFIALASLCIAHYLVFAKLMAPALSRLLQNWILHFQPVRYDKSFSSLLSFKKRKRDFFFPNNRHLKIKVIGNVCIN